ncbi:ATP-dependent DNA helicase PIF1-like [Stegodyphus dumicola]|uniref:ATP-dependent DNA helicase PIF1-like n=1 Tax=Stegodyphus dumicola TaxID=202533 RepID=UPI0015AE983F|nr:ATP-dependent DNA helicase PIF1-like [Stegodyphus dumicola]
MSHKAAFEALDVTMKDLRRNNDRMGGVVMVLAGDFRQTLPVIPRGTRADEMQACIKSSYIWNGIQTLGLSTNIRVHLNGDPSAQQFADNLLKLGNGALTSENEDGYVAMQGIGRIVTTEEELKEAVFPNVIHHFTDHAWLCERAILAPTNEAVSVINKELLQNLPGTLHIYKSIDTTCNIDEAVNYTTEFLNKLEPPGVPSHILDLKVGAPIILLRNLDPPALCNGTRLSIKKLMPNIIEATIMTGHAAGEDVFISRIPTIPSDFQFQFKRLQFPVRLSFAMSINKAQGQSLKVVGLDLRKPCFSHGQLYVGCSRVGNADNLHILAPNGRTLNIVYPEAL